MSTAEGAEVEFPALPAFDKNALRRAIRRGVLRTAFVGAVWLVVGSFFASIAGAFAVGALGRRDHLHRVVETGWQVAHPEYLLREQSDGIRGLHANRTDTVLPLGVDAAPAGTEIAFHESVFGGVSHSRNDPTDSASGVLSGLGDPAATGANVRAGEEKTLENLPASVHLAAVVQFATPLSNDDYLAFMRRTGGPAAPPLMTTVLMSDAASPGDDMIGTHPIRGVYGWSPVYAETLSDDFRFSTDVVGGFRRWVGGLHDSDRNALAEVGVDLRALRAAAGQGRVHGVFVTGVSASTLLATLKDPAVGAVHTYDVAFDVEG